MSDWNRAIERALDHELGVEEHRLWLALARNLLGYRKRSDRLGVALLRTLFAPELVDAIERLVDERVTAALAEQDDLARWMTIEEAAEHLRSTPEALRKRAQRGNLPGAVKDGDTDGGRWLVDARQLDASLDPGTFGRDQTKRGERRGNGPAPGTGNGGSDA